MWVVKKSTILGFAKEFALKLIEIGRWSLDFLKNTESWIDFLIGYGAGTYGPGQWSEMSTGPQAKIVVNTTGSPQSFTFMGKLNTYQNVLSDTYTDTLTLTLVY